MWEAKNFFKPWRWIMEMDVFNPDAASEQLGWLFTCPKCKEISVIPTEEGYAKCLEAAAPPPEAFEDAWESQGTKEALTLSPSIVCTTENCSGHYWIKYGVIQNC